MMPQELQPCMEFLKHLKLVRIVLVMQNMLKHIAPSLLHLCSYVVSRKDTHSHRYQWRETSAPTTYLPSFPASMTVSNFSRFLVSGISAAEEQPVTLQKQGQCFVKRGG